MEGVEYVKRSINARSTSKFSEGDGITIFYDPADPQRYYVLEEADSTIVIIALLMIAFGVAFILIGIFPNLVFTFGFGAGSGRRR